MNQACSFLTGLGLGAGLMYLLDPQMGGRRRALVRDRAVHLAHDAQEALEVVGTDMVNRTQGLRAGDFSVLAGGKRALENPLSGSWSPSARAIMAGVGVGLFIYGLTQSAPVSCLLGTAGCALLAEGATNAGLDDLASAGSQVVEGARELAGRTGFTGQSSRQFSTEPVTTGG